MSRRLDLHGFNTALGRRIVLLFVVSALVPMTLVGVEAFRRVARLYAAHANERLTTMTQSASNAVLDRLQLAAAELDLLTQSLQLGVAAPSFSRFRMLEGATLVTRAGSERVGDGVYPPRSMPLLASGDYAPAIRVAAVRADTGSASVLLGRPLAGKGTLWATVNTDSLLATARLYAEGPPPALLCLVDAAGAPISCPAPLGALAAEPVPGERGRSQGLLAGAQAKPDTLVAWRQIFLKVTYGSPPWRLFLAQQRGTQLTAASDFRWIFPRILVIALALVVLVSNSQIRRSLRPLEVLAGAARRLGKGELEARAAVVSRDEFGQLAMTFNDMAAKLEHEIGALDALRRFDRSVLAAPTRATIVDGVLDRAREAVGADAAGIWLREHAEVGVVHAAMAGNSAGKVTARVRSEDSHPASAPVAAATRPALVAAVPPFSVDAFRSYLTIPVGRAGEAGVLVFAAYGSASFDRTRVAAALQLGEQVTLALSAVGMVAQLEAAEAGALAALGRSVDLVSPWTAGHAERVAALATAIGRALALPDIELDRLLRAALLHDIGKIGIPPGILDKPGRLSAQEMEKMQEHVALGRRVLEPIAAFADILPIVEQHHERFDGTGYPAGRRGEEIEPLARVLAVADVFDGLTTDRPYRKALTTPQALTIIREELSHAFDPAVLRALHEVLGVAALGTAGEESDT